MSKAYITMHTDGCTLGNLGPSGVGIILRKGRHHKTFYKSIGHATNNACELLAVIIGLEAIKIRTFRVTIYTDSQYVSMGYNGDWNIKTNGHLWRRLRSLAANFPEVRISWIPREQNTEADRLSKKGANQELSRLSPETQEAIRATLENTS